MMVPNKFDLLKANETMFTQRLHDTNVYEKYFKTLSFQTYFLSNASHCTF